MATTTMAAKCFSNGFVINWKVGGFLENGQGDRYSDEFEVRDKPNIKWRLRVVARYVEQIDRTVVYVYLCNPPTVKNNVKVRFMAAIYHDGGACSCEDKVSEPVDFSQVPQGQGVGFAWFFCREKFDQQINAGNTNGFVRIGFAMEYVDNLEEPFEDTVPLFLDYGTRRGNFFGAAGDELGATGGRDEIGHRNDKKTDEELNVDDLFRTLNVDERMASTANREQLEEYLRDKMDNTTNLGQN